MTVSDILFLVFLFIWLISFLYYVIQIKKYRKEKDEEKRKSYLDKENYSSILMTVAFIFMVGIAVFLNN